MSLRMMASKRSIHHKNRDGWFEFGLKMFTHLITDIYHEFSLVQYSTQLKPPEFWLCAKFGISVKFQVSGKLCIHDFSIIQNLGLDIQKSDIRPDIASIFTSDLQCVRLLVTVAGAVLYVANVLSLVLLVHFQDRGHHDKRLPFVVRACAVGRDETWTLQQVKNWNIHV